MLDHADQTPVPDAPAALPVKRAPYPPRAPRPTQPGPHGIRFDFNAGCRVFLPERSAGKWRVRLTDLDAEVKIYETEAADVTIGSARQWFVRFGIDVWALDEGGGASELVLHHEYDNSGQTVLIQFPVGTLGDTMAWFPYAARFAAAHPGCRVVCALSGLIIPLFKNAYPDIEFLTHEQVRAQELAEQCYATYALGVFFDDDAGNRQPTDFRLAGLHRTAAYILGVDPAEAPPQLALTDESRPIAEPYVCIGVQSSCGCKYWTHPTGWIEIVAALKVRGYRVICIDQKPVHGSGLMWTAIPNGAENETGDRPLAERARWLRHAAFFVGLSSGLSWLAWAAGTKVVMISGFTHPSNEFATPYRVINFHACNSCWNDPAIRFSHTDFFWCPRHAGTPRQFECTRQITPGKVLRVIETIPDILPPPADIASQGA